MARDPRDILQEFARDSTPPSGPAVPNMGGITADKPQPFTRPPATPAPATNTPGRPPVATPTPAVPGIVAGLPNLGEIPDVSELTQLSDGLRKGRGRTLFG